MERGPMALFGAIVAVGLGPAMWLGAQFGQAADVPAKAPAVSSQGNANQQVQNKGGGAAGAAPEDPSVVLETKPRADYKPLTRIRPHASPSSSVSADPDPSADPSASASPSTGAGGQESTPPTESTTDPGGPPSDGGGGGDDGGPVQLPSPPADQAPGGSGSGVQQS